MKLMIIESPGKRKKLTEILGKLQPGVNWRIEASIGHVRDLPSKGNRLDQIVTGIKRDFTPVYELSERGTEVVRKLKKLAREADEIYLATDPDREGESISWHLQQALSLKNPIRITFNEINAPKVQAALAAPGRIDVKMVGAQEARRVLDRLVGYMVSPELRRQTGEPLSAGRVQSPAVYLVVQRERQIRAFVKTDHFGARLFFADAKMERWHADWETQPDFVSKESPYFMDKTIAQQIADTRHVLVESCEETEETRKPPAPLTTSLLQQAASNALRFNPKRTMELAQRLYEQGHITYMRTDNPNIGDDSMPELRSAAAALGIDVVAKRRTYKAKEGAQEGHPAITPSHWDVAEAGENPDEIALYQLIRNRAIGSQLAEARYAVRTVVLRAEDPLDGKTVRFKASGRTVMEKGWLKLLDGDATDDRKDEEAPNTIPPLEIGQRLDVQEGKLLEKSTKAPPRYTEASLVKALEAEGVGRPSTYASIMENIIGRSYVELAGRYLKPTARGEQIVDALLGNFEFIQLGFTKELESDLDRIAAGKSSYKSVIERLYQKLKEEIEVQQSKVPDAPRARGDEPSGQRKTSISTEYPCKRCGKPLVLREKKGGYSFYGCSGFKEGCKTTYPNVNGKPAYDKVAA